MKDQTVSFDVSQLTVEYENYGRIDGTVAILGFGSIGRGLLPLIQRHFSFDKERLVVVEPKPHCHENLRSMGIRVLDTAIRPDNFREILRDLFPDGKGFCVNVSVDTSSLDLMRECRKLGVLYLDTVVEPWEGFYFGRNDNARRTNYALREAILSEKQASPGGVTAVSCCGANPGMASWLVKEALMQLAARMGFPAERPGMPEGWGRLMSDLGVTGIHIAERDTQVRLQPRTPGLFVNTWSVDGFIAEGYQPAELG